MITDEQKEVQINESLVKADHSLQFAINDLRGGLPFMSPVESMIVLPLLEQIAKIDNVVTQLLAARNDITH